MVDDFYGRITSRSQDVQARYDARRAALRLQYGKDAPCPFCDDSRRDSSKDYGGIFVLANNYPYEVFDGRGVKEHLMIVPGRHVANFSDFTETEIATYWQVLSKYHAKGYSSMTRSAIDTARSVPAHLHTHLFLYFTDNE